MPEVKSCIVNLAKVLRELCINILMPWHTSWRKQVVTSSRYAITGHRHKILIDWSASYWGCNICPEWWQLMVHIKQKFLSVISRSLLFNSSACQSPSCENNLSPLFFLSTTILCLRVLLGRGSFMNRRHNWVFFHSADLISGCYASFLNAVTSLHLVLMNLLKDAWWQLFITVFVWALTLKRVLFGVAITAFKRAFEAWWALSRTTFWWNIHPRLLRDNLNVALTLHDLEELSNVSGRWKRLMAKTLIAQSVARVEDP